MFWLGGCCKKLLIFCRDFYVFFSGFFDKEVDIQGIKKEILSRQKWKDSKIWVEGGGWLRLENKVRGVLLRFGFGYVHQLHRWLSKFGLFFFRKYWKKVTQLAFQIFVSGQFLSLTLLSKATEKCWCEVFGIFSSLAFVYLFLFVCLFVYLFLLFMSCIELRIRKVAKYRKNLCWL
jgi:cellulose synthase/poly-beta-1,6-N-acetylglucosamine synthase-like glycosyltransferase